MSRTDEWQKDISGMITTALVDVYLPGEVSINGSTVQHDVALVSVESLGLLMSEAGYRQTVHGDQS